MALCCFRSGAAVHNVGGTAQGDETPASSEEEAHNPKALMGAKTFLRSDSKGRGAIDAIQEDGESNPPNPKKLMGASTFLRRESQVTMGDPAAHMEEDERSRGDTIGPTDAHNPKTLMGAKTFLRHQYEEEEGVDVTLGGGEGGAEDRTNGEGVPDPPPNAKTLMGVKTFLRSESKGHGEIDTGGASGEEVQKDPPPNAKTLMGVKTFLRSESKGRGVIDSGGVSGEEDNGGVEVKETRDSNPKTLMGIRTFLRKSSTERMSNAETTTTITKVDDDTAKAKKTRPSILSLGSFLRTQSMRLSQRKVDRRDEWGNEVVFRRGADGKGNDALALELSDVPEGDVVAYAEKLAMMIPDDWVGWASESNIHGVVARAVAINEALDKLIMPVLDDVEAKFDAGSKWGEVGLTDLLADIMNSIKEIFHSRKEQKLIFSAVATAVRAQWQIITNNETQYRRYKLLYSVVHSRCLNRLVGLANIVMYQRVGLEDKEVARRNLSSWQRFLTWFGIDYNDFPAVLTPTSKAFNIYLESISSYGERNIPLRVKRGNVIESIQEEIHTLVFEGEESPTTALRSKACKLSPRFVEEYDADTIEQGDGHGPRKEFFDLVGSSAAGLLAQSQPINNLVCYRRSAGAFWINTEIVKNEEREIQYKIFGWLIGQCINNRCALGIALPAIFFELILDGDQFRPSLDQLHDFDPTLGDSLRKISKLSESEYQDVLRLEDFPCETSREEYVQQACHRMVHDDISWQMTAIREGFWKASQMVLLGKWKVCSLDMAGLISGTVSDKNIELTQHFKFVFDDDIKSNDVFMMSILTALAALDQEEKMAFVHFVTGTSRLPYPGMEMIKVDLPFVAYGNGHVAEQLGMLPQAHTCENILELPHYFDSLVASGVVAAETVDVAKLSIIIRERIVMAATCCTGYQLDGIE